MAPLPGVGMKLWIAVSAAGGGAAGRRQSGGAAGCAGVNVCVRAVGGAAQRTHGRAQRIQNKLHSTLPQKIT